MVRYIIEHKTKKGWEISSETNSISAANADFLAIIVDGPDARITAEEDNR